MPPTTRGTIAPRRKDKNSIVAPLEPPEASDILQLPTPKRRKRGPTDDEYLQFARALVGDDTKTALRVAGHQDDSSVSPEGKWCVCGIAEDEVVSMEDMIRCDDRQVRFPVFSFLFMLRQLNMPSATPAGSISAASNSPVIHPRSLAGSARIVSRPVMSGKRSMGSSVSEAKMVSRS